MDSKYITGKVEGKTLVVDDIIIEDAEVKNCTLIFNGGPLPTFNKTTFENCAFRFEGAADRTLHFFAMLYANGGKNVVEGAMSRVVNGDYKFPDPTKTNTYTKN